MSQPVKAIHNMLVQHDMHERRAHHICILRLPNNCRFMNNNLMIFSFEPVCIYAHDFDISVKVTARSYEWELIISVTD